MSETDWLESLHIEDNSLTSEILENEREAREEDEGGMMSKKTEKFKWTPEMQKRYEKTLARLDRELKPVIDGIRASQNITAEDLNIIVTRDDLTREAIKEPPFVKVEV